jgi:outer membrane receptor protein involved in Fe transport
MSQRNNNKQAFTCSSMTNFKQQFKKSLVAISVTSLLSLSVVPAMAADNFSGTVKGQLSSASAANMENATITLKHKAKGISRTIQADDQGNYILRKLPIGTYLMTIEKTGFKTESFDVLVKIGSAIVLNKELYASNSDIERIEVSGANVSYIDLSSSTGGVVVTAEDLVMLPVNTGFNNMALLAPGVAGTNAGNFRGSPSIGGSSSAENGYYLNGLNVTKIKTGLGSIDLPWEAIAQTEIKTGGVAPEFGNALGGIVNAISKSGSNEFEFGVQARVDPEALREHHDDLFYANDDIYSNSSDDESTFTRYSVWGSGAIVEDKLFFYALLAPQKNDYDAGHDNTFDIGESTSDRWFAKVDWFITDNHSLEFTAINYENENTWKTYEYNWETNERGGEGTKAKVKTGGDVFGLKYTGILSDDLSIEVVAGRTTDETFNTVADAKPWVGSYLFDGYRQLSQHTSSKITESEFTRDQFRVDIMWDLEDHALKFGADYYDTHVDHQSTQNGIDDAQGWWYVYTATGTDHSGLPAGEGYVDQRIRTDFSDSHVKSLSLYAQDSWQVNDNLVLNLGVRYSDFVNEMSDGQKYVDVSGQVAPRLQAIYDLEGDGTSKVFATFGRYFQPVSANMNIVQGGSRRDEHWYYKLDQLDADGHPVIKDDYSPSRGEQVGTFLAQSGEGAPGSKADADLKPMYSDEFTLGYQTEIFDGDMTFGVRGVYRELKRSIEDADLQTVLKNWYAKEGIAADGWIDGWILFNPGRGLDVEYDFNGDGTVNHIELSAEDLGMPKSKRKYGALEFTLDGQVTEKLNINASYTWSHLWGNTAGLVNDDDNQSDPGWTVSYDYAGLQDNASGNLPSDRRHAFKLYGSYQVTDDFIVGVNTLISDGKPINLMGIHPSGVGACAAGMPWESCPSNIERDHGDSFYDAEGNASPRGSAGTTDWVVKIDVSATYFHELFGNNLMLKATVYNVLNDDTQTTVYQQGTMTGDNGDVVADPNWGMTTGRQGARFVSFVARYEF